MRCCVDAMQKCTNFHFLIRRYGVGQTVYGDLTATVGRGSANCSSGHVVITTCNVTLGGKVTVTWGNVCWVGGGGV